jgi:hypothetical protein
VVGAAGLGGDLAVAVAVAVAVGGGAGGIIGPAGGRDRRRLTARAAIQCHRGGGAHDRGGVGGGGCSTRWLRGGGGGREYWREGNDHCSLVLFFWWGWGGGISLWGPFNVSVPCILQNA